MKLKLIQVKMAVQPTPETSSVSNARYTMENVQHRKHCKKLQNHEAEDNHTTPPTAKVENALNFSP